MNEYLIEGHPLFLDLDEARIALRNVEISIGARKMVIPSVDLDTGFTAGMFGPQAELDALLGDDWAARTLRTLNGPLLTRAASATVVLGSGLLTQRIEVLAAPGVDRWLLGLPVIRAFDLLLRGDQPHGHIAVLSPR
ncbi:MAG: hypothetical protein ABIO70_21170 [Pseudomonadota bacterium]